MPAAKGVAKPARQAVPPAGTFDYAQQRIAKYDTLIHTWQTLTPEELADLDWDGNQLEQDIADLKTYRDQLAAHWQDVDKRRTPRQRVA